MNDWLRDAITFAPRDPLALDLDNDGIETVAINPTAPILFDHNGDGTTTATGWLKGDDGWLVRDLDGDGKITSGKELLGVDTDITVGGVTRKASTGFEALRALDTHQAGDGKNLFDSRDAAFSQLRVWQDKNQNGVTDAGELSALNALGIVSIQLQETPVSKDLGGGNSITGKAKVTRRVGSSTSESEMDSVLVTSDSAANLNLADNPFYSKLEDVPVTNAARQLPNMLGSGLVHSLHEAMSLGTASSNALTSTVQTFSAATTRDAQMALLDTLITEWGATSRLVTSGSPSTVVWGATIANPQLTATTQQRITTFAQNDPEMYRKVIVLEQFNGQMGLAALMTRWNITLPAAVTNSLNAAYAALSESVYGALSTQTRLKPYLDAISLTVDDRGLRFDTTTLAAKINATMQANAGTAIEDLVDLVRFDQSILGAIGFDGSGTLRELIATLPAGSPILGKLQGLNLLRPSLTTGTDRNDVYLGDNNANSFNGGAGNDVLDGGNGNDALSGGDGADTYIFGKGFGQDIINNGDADTVGSNADTVMFVGGLSPSDITLARISDYFGGSSIDDLVIRIKGTDDKLTIKGFFTSDGVTNRVVERLQFSSGVEWDVAAVRAAVTQGTDGSDTLYGFGYGEFINGGNGNDTVYGQGGSDTLDGGLGNDALTGGPGNNTYLFGKGDGQDVISSDYDTTVGKFNVLKFKAGVAPSEIVVKRSGADLVLSIAGTTDTVTIGYFFSGDDPANAYNPIQQISFDNGNSWDITTIKSMAITGNNTAQTLTGYNGGDIINAASGNDTVYGQGGSDTLNGGAGADSLYGGRGDDTLDGGADNDQLAGDLGNDTYLFGKGDGQDTITSDYDTTVGKLNVLKFKAGVDPSEVVVTRSDTDLVLSIAGTLDKVTVRYFFYDDGPANASNPVQQISFENGISWNIATIKAMAIAGKDTPQILTGYIDGDIINAAGDNDTVYGLTGSDTLDGGAGVDSLYGGNGDDVLDGGGGNDSLWGENGSDTYLFYAGAGNDTIDNRDYLRESSARDVVKFTGGIKPSDLLMERTGWAGYDLRVSLKGSTDSLVIIDATLAGGGYSQSIDGFVFDGGVAWDYSAIIKAMSTPTSGNDLLHLGNGNDSVEAGAGDDTVDGWYGDDSISGGVGDDQIDGGQGRNTYYFDIGDGRDTIYFHAYQQTDTNFIVFGSKITPSMLAFSGDRYGITVHVGANDSIALPRFQSMYDGDLFFVFGDKTLSVRDVWAQLKQQTDGDDYIYKPLQNVSAGKGGDTIVGAQYEATTLTGGVGDDVYYVDGWQIVVEQENEGRDKIDSTSSLALPENVEDLVLDTYSEWAINATGNKLSNTLAGNVYDNLLKGEAGDDALFGNWGIDTLEGGAGQDRLYGGDGADTYVYKKGDGYDVVYGQRSEDTLIMTGFASTEVTFSRRFSDIDIGHAPSGTRHSIVTLVRQAFDSTHEFTGVSQIIFDDKTLSADDIRKAALKGTSGSDTNLRGYATNDSIEGAQGNDSLYGEGGQDTLNGGTGADRLEGSSGNDTYVFATGDGTDVIYDNDATAGNTDVISFTNVKSTDIVSVVRNASNGLVLNHGTADSITIDNYFTSSSYRVEHFKFSDGVTWTAAAVDAIMANGLIKLPAGGSTWEGKNTADVVFGSSGIDSVSGLAGSDWLHGNSGNDILRGGEGADLLVGGLGSDALYGDAGADTYIYNKGDGYDVIYGQRAEDTLIMKGFKSTDVTFNRTFSDINIGYAPSGTSYNILTLVRQALDSPHEFTGVSQIIFDDRTLSADDIRKEALKGTTGNDTNLRGYASNDTINGFDGDDSLYGEGGDDKLYGGLGSDLLDGGTGNDYLDGNKGNDTYLFSRGGGSDTIYDADVSVGNADVLQFQSGIAHDQLWFSQSGGNLIISVIGTTDSIKIAGGASALTSFHVEQFTAGGKTLSDTKVANLIQAMASMTPPAMGQTMLTDAQRTQLAPVLAANWG